MLISQKLNQAMNEQIGSELGASNQYLQVAAHFANENLPELAGYFFRQSDEERAHALKFVHYILDTGGKVAVPAVNAPVQNISSAEQAAQLSLDSEIKVTGQVNNLQRIATTEQDFAALEFLSWFASEQIEEVATMTELLNTIRRAGDQILLVEATLARRGDPHAGK
jgi:ferritin